MFTPTSWNSSPAPYHSSNRGGDWGQGTVQVFFFPDQTGPCLTVGQARGMLEVGVPAAEALKYTTAWHAKPVWIGQLDRGELDVNEASYCLPDELENGRAKTLLTTETLAAFRNFKMDGPLVM